MRLLILMFLLLSGCYANGIAYKPDTPVKDSALIYIYWPLDSSKGINLDYPNIYIDGSKIGGLKKGGYLVAQVIPANHFIKIGDNALNWGFKDLYIDIETEKGKKYFYKMTVTNQKLTFGTEHTVKITPVDNTLALEEIQATKLSN